MGLYLINQIWCWLLLWDKKEQKFLRIFLECIFQPLEHIWLTKASCVLSISCSCSIIRMMSSVDQCDVLWNDRMFQISLDYIMTEGSRVKSPRDNTENEYGLFYVSVSCFSFSFSVGAEKNAFAKSMWVYRVPETLPLCPNKTLPST